jgi:hypothetical protein
MRIPRKEHGSRKVFDKTVPLTFALRQRTLLVSCRKSQRATGAECNPVAAVCVCCFACGAVRLDPINGPFALYTSTDEFFRFFLLITRVFPLTLSPVLRRAAGSG